MKKIISFFMVVFMISTFCCTVYASDSGIMPLWDNISMMTNTLVFDSNRNGTCTATVTGKSGTTKITGTLTVYKEKPNGAWEYVDSDEGTVTSGILALSVEFKGESGVKYKSEFNVVVTANGKDEPEMKPAYKTCP